MPRTLSSSVLGVSGATVSGATLRFMGRPTPPYYPVGLTTGRIRYCIKMVFICCRSNSTTIHPAFKKGLIKHEFHGTYFNSNQIQTKSGRKVIDIDIIILTSGYDYKLCSAFSDYP